jgi:hypothetical protein
MGLGYVARLEHGSYFMNLDGSGQYALAQDFVPPIANITPQFYTGTSANRYGGGGLAWERAENVSWSFGVSVAGASKAEVRHGIMELNRFLARAGDEIEPLYFAWRNHDIYPFEPLWGQCGAFTRLEIVHGIAEYDPGYGGYPPEMHAQMLPNCIVTLTVRPYALGLRQRLASAMGGIAEDIFGTQAGVSRGLQINEGLGNKFTNPVFGHSTWNNGWVASSADLVASKNTNPDFLLFGGQSAKLTNTSTSAAAAYRQSINVGNTNTHYLVAYVKRADGGQISAGTCVLDYNGGISTTYYNLGNGFWRLTGSAPGIAGAAPVGLRLAAGQTVYLDAMMLYESSHFAPLAIGDFLGCAWTGTPHDSATTRTRGQVRLPVDDVFDNARGTIRVVWRADASSAQYGSNAYLFLVNATTPLFLRWRQESSQWQFYNAVSSPTSFSAGQVHVFHAVYGGTGYSLYLNGQLIASDPTPYAPLIAPTHLYIGTNQNGTDHMRGVFQGFTTFNMGMTAAQVAQDYADIAPIALAGEAVDPIPWLWTKDGDDVVDNCDDSSRDNWCVCGGIMGDAPARTRYEIHNITSAVNQKGVYLGGYGYPRFIHPGNWYTDVVDQIDASCSGGGYEETTGWPLEAMGLIQSIQEQPTNINFHYFTRFRRSGGSVTVTPYWSQSLGGDTPGAEVTLNSDNTFRIFYVGSLYYRKSKVFKGSDFELYYGLKFSDAVDLDYHQVIPGDVIRLYSTSNIANVLSVINLYVGVEDGSAYNRTTKALRPLFTAGTMPELKPGLINTIWLIIGDSGEEHRTSSSATLVIYATPRWRLL